MKWTLKHRLPYSVNLTWLAGMSKEVKLIDVNNLFNLKDPRHLYFTRDRIHKYENVLFKITQVNKRIYYYSIWDGYFDMFANKDKTERLVIYPDKDVYIPFLNDEKVRNLFFNHEVLKKLASKPDTFKFLKKEGIKESFSYVFAGLMVLEIVKSFKEYSKDDKDMEHTIKDLINQPVFNVLFTFNPQHNIMNFREYAKYLLEHYKELLEIDKKVKEYGVDKAKLYKTTIEDGVRVIMSSTFDLSKLEDTLKSSE